MTSKNKKTTLRTGIYRCQNSPFPPVYAQIKETGKTFVLTWHLHTLDAYEGTKWYDDCCRSGSWAQLVRFGPCGEIWRQNKKGDWSCTIRKARPKHAIDVCDDACWIFPYRCGPSVKWDYVGDTIPHHEHAFIRS